MRRAASRVQASSRMRSLASRIVARSAGVADGLAADYGWTAAAAAIPAIIRDIGIFFRTGGGVEKGAPDQGAIPE